MAMLNTKKEYAMERDGKDPLAVFRPRFAVPENTIYMDGNSLGLFSHDAAAEVLRVVDEWKQLGIRGWMEGNPPWFHYSEDTGAMAAKIVGASEDEVVLTGATTTNLHALCGSFFAPQGAKRKILADELTFPSDIYALGGLLKSRGLDPETDLVLTRSKDGKTLDEDDIVRLMTPETALVLLPSVLYRSGQLLDIAGLTEEAHKRDIPIGFDCSHSAGVVEHRFDDWDVDFAFWCSYKYMNGGPGATALLYVNRRNFGVAPALPGWFGYNKERQFDMDLSFEPSGNAGAWQISTPTLFSSAGVRGALKVTLEAGISQIRQKSLELTEYMMYLIEEELIKPGYGFGIATPREANRRGGHVALTHVKEAVRVNEALKKRGIIPDFRTPDIIRLAPVPLYCTFEDVWNVVMATKDIMDTGEYLRFSDKRQTVA